MKARVLAGRFEVAIDDGTRSGPVFCVRAGSDEEAEALGETLVGRRCFAWPVKAPARLTSAQRRALFTVGAFGSWKRYGAHGKTAQTRVRCSLEYASDASGRDPYVTWERETLANVLTEAGRVRFDKEFGAPCPEHGWGVYGARFGARADGTYPCCCAGCREVIRRVDGYEVKCSHVQAVAS